MKILIAILFTSLMLVGGNVTPQSIPPDCTDGDCWGPPSCTNGDCTPPDCTNGDCETDVASCCCVGSNTPGSTRVCCCPSTDLDGLTCRLSIVLEAYDEYGNFHQTLAQETLSGIRPANCDVLLARFCDPPDEYVCTRKKGQRVCTWVTKAACKAITRMCQYRFCGPDWFPHDELTPEKEGCQWWDRIYPCQRR